MDLDEQTRGPFRQGEIIWKDRPAKLCTQGRAQYPQVGYGKGRKSRQLNMVRFQPRTQQWSVEVIRKMRHGVQRFAKWLCGYPCRYRRCGNGKQRLLAEALISEAVVGRL